MSSVRHVRRGFASTKMWNFLATVTGVGAFVQQVSQGDIAYANQQGSWANRTASSKLYFIANSVIARVTGWNPFSTQAGAKWTQKINPAGIANKWTGLGIAALIYSIIPHMPQRSKVKKFGEPLLAAGILGGLFDPSGQAITRSPAYNSPSIRGAVSTGVNAQ